MDHQETIDVVWEQALEQLDCVRCGDFSAFRIDSPNPWEKVYRELTSQYKFLEQQLKETDRDPSVVEIRLALILMNSIRTHGSDWTQLPAMLIQPEWKETISNISFCKSEREGIYEAAGKIFFNLC